MANVGVCQVESMPDNDRSRCDFLAGFHSMYCQFVLSDPPVFFKGWILEVKARCEKNGLRWEFDKIKMVSRES